ncbi:MAG: V-type ATP synthase subunit K [Planctomycetota bacterium]|nr:V-type ATP synthase subunit K [Planctomycetota bacterium]
MGGWTFVAQLGVILGFALGATGSVLGIWAAGTAAAGAWARDAKAGKRLRFPYIIFIGAPLSQTFYAMIVMNSLGDVVAAGAAAMAANAGLVLGIGLATGLGEMLSAWGQGVIGAAAVRCMSEADGKGLAFLLIAIGIIETVGIFTMVFMLGQVPAV